VTKKEDEMDEFTLSSGARMRPSTTTCRHGTILGVLTLMWIAAPSVAVATTPTGMDARQLAEHVAAGEAATASAAAGEIYDPQVRVLKFFRGYLSWLSAYELDGDPSHLCSAHDLLQRVLDEDKIDVRVRADAQVRLTELDTLLSERHASTICGPIAEAGVDQAPSASSTGVPPSPAELASRHDDDARDTAGSPLVAVTRSPAPTGALHHDDARSSAPAPVQRLRIAAGLSLGVGASLLGVMTYGLVVDARAAALIREYGQQKDAGELTATEWAQSQRIGEDGRAGARLATMAGIGGGVGLISGAALLLLARKHARDDKRTLSLLPTVGGGQAHLTLRGRF